MPDVLVRLRPRRARRVPPRCPRAPGPSLGGRQGRARCTRPLSRTGDHRPGRRRGASVDPDRARARPRPGAASGAGRLPRRVDRLPAVARRVDDQRPDRRRGRHRAVAVRGTQPPWCRAAARDDRGRPPVRQREAARARPDPDDVRRADDPFETSPLRSRGTVRLAGLPTVRPEVGALRGGPGTWVARCSNMHRRPRERWPTARSRQASTTRCKPPERRGRLAERQSTGSSGQAGPVRGAVGGGVRAGRLGRDGGAAHGQACALLGCPSRAGQPGDDVGQSPGPAGLLHRGSAPGAGRPRMSASSTCSSSSSPSRCGGPGDVSTIG